NESGKVGSVLFGYDGNPKMHNENYLPYSVNGDWNGMTNAWKMSPGLHILVVTPYQKIRNGGAAGPAEVLKFTVTKSSAAAVTPPVDSPPVLTLHMTTPPVGSPVVTLLPIAPPVITPTPILAGTTWVVDPTGANGASKTVAAAIALAQPGDTVL